MESLRNKLLQIINSKTNLILGLVFLLIFCAIIIHVPGVNGPPYWQWIWQRSSVAGYLGMLLAAIPFFAGQFLYYKTNRVNLGLVSLVLSGILLQLVYT